MAVRISLEEIDPGQINAAVTETLLEGNKVSEWWKNQDALFAQRTIGTVRQGLQDGLTSSAIAANLRSGVFKGAKHNAQALVSTSINAVSNKARMASFQQNDDVIKGMQQVSTLDSRTSDICIAYSGMSWDLEGNPLPGTTLPFNGGPPRHFNCRSTLIPVLKSFDELGFDREEFPEGTRASMDGQVPATTTFDQFLKGKSKTFQDELLGPARAKLWRSNKITLSQLVDMRGNPLTVEELERLAKKPRRKKPRKVTEVSAAVAAAPPIVEPVPVAEPWEGVPQFKSVQQGEDWIKVNATDPNGRYTTATNSAGNTVNESAKLVKGWHRQGVRITASVTKMLERRFGLKLPQYLGRRDQHPEFRFKKSSPGALASVHMKSDSLLMGKQGVDVAGQHKYSKSLKVHYEAGRSGKSERASQQLQKRRDKNALLLKDDNVKSDKALVAALKDQKKKDDFVFTAGDNGTTGGNASVWRTMVHEGGHRMHAQHLQEINDILNREFGLVYNGRMHSLSFDRTATQQRRERFKAWQSSTSDYAGANGFELVAEQFTRYMLGEEVRVHPAFLKFFKKLDKEPGVYGHPDELKTGPWGDEDI